MSEISFANVVAAAETIRGVATRTPVLTSRHVDESVGARVFFKCENFQRVGAFKFRGAYNALSRLSDVQKRSGVVAFSSGNHAQAVALAARLLGMAATIVMPSDAPPAKLAATRGYGAEVILYDRAKNALAVIAALPFSCNRMGEASPDGRFVFCVSGVSHKGVLVDVEKKTAVPVTAGGGIGWMSSDTFAYSRELPDSDLRGTWLQTVGQGERRVSPEPYLANEKGDSMLMLKSSGVLVFATKRGIAKMKPDGSEFEEFIRLQNPPRRILEIEAWKN